VVTRALAIVCALGATAAADKLDDARAAVDGVRYDDAQRLLVEALAQGDAAPAKLFEIYRLSAITAIVLNQPDAAELFYRRWLALDPDAALGADVAPKLRAPFDAAKAFIAAHGRFEVTSARLSDRELEIDVVSDPIVMARSARIAGQAAIPLGPDRRVRLTAAGGDLTAIVTDEYGNHLVELHSPPPPPPSDLQPPISRHHESHTGALLGWGIPCVVFLGAGVGFTAAALYENSKLDELVANSKLHFYTEVKDRQNLRTAFTALGASLFGIGAVLAIPTAIYFARSRSPDELGVTPYASDASTGLAISGRF